MDKSGATEATQREQTVALQDELDRRITVEADLSGRLADETRRGLESAELFRLLVTSVVDYAIYFLDPLGLVATWNAGAERLKGYRADEIIGRHFSVFYPDEDVRAGKCEHELAEAARTGRYEEEGWRVRKDGSRFWANVVLTAVRDDRGVLIGYAKVTRDLTARLADERARLSAEARFRLLVESVRDYALLILDPTGHIVTWNVGAERIKGYRADEIIGKHFSIFYPREDVAAGKCDYELEAAEREGRFEDENWRVRKDGSKFWANVVISAVRDGDGKLVGFSKVTRDLTDRKRSEDEREARIAAEQASRTKDEFIAMLSHELRNPLAPIVTALQLIKLRGDTRSAREYEIIERQVKNMMHLVDDLLDVSRITRGKIELVRRHLDVREVLVKSIEIASPLFEQRGHDFVVDAPSGPLEIMGDEVRLTQVVSNLLTNAAKYTEPGGKIRVELRRTDGMIEIRVCDNGVGIDPQLLPHVFELFVQGRQSSDRAAGGLGLGLTLVHSLVQLHGGTVEARSPGPGLGSTFIVRLPAMPAPVAQPVVPAPAVEVTPDPAKHRILIVDDNDDARELLADVLGSIGHDVRTAGDGPDALKLIETFTPDIGILDIGLPGMDGYELAQQVRARLGATPKLVSLTGYGQPSDLERSREAGFDRHLVKPVELKRLLQALADLTTRAG